MTRDRVFARLVCAAVLAGTLVGVAAGSAAAGTSPNLIVNGNADAASGSKTGYKVPLPGWTVSPSGTLTADRYGISGGYPKPTDPGPPDRGANFFAGGCPKPCQGIPYAKDKVEQASQKISLSKYHTKIAGGSVTFALSGWFGGWSGQTDQSALTVTWLDGTGKTVGTTTIGNVSAAARGNHTGLLLRTKNGSVPATAQQATITLTCTKGLPTVNNWYNDGYADSLSLVLSGV